MATYTAFMTSPELMAPTLSDDGQTWGVHVSADVIVLDQNNQLIPPYGNVEPWLGFLTLPSSTPISASDTLTSIKAKIMAAFRANYAPTIVDTDIVRVLWMNSGSTLLTL